MKSVEVAYLYLEGGKSALEEDLTRDGRANQVRWLVQQIERLNEDDVEREFNRWPMKGPEGQWGSIAIDVYVVMCQVLIPPIHERRLGASVLLKVVGVGPEGEILRRLREIAAESPGDV